MVRTTILYTLVLSLQGCSFTYRDSPPYEGPYSRFRVEPNIEKVWADSLYIASLPDTGAYYAYRFDDEHRSIRNIENMIADLYARGFDITAAWYGSPGPCRPPGSHVITATVHKPIFVILLAKRDDGLIKFWFWPLWKPKSLLCRYGMSMYTCE